LKSTKPKLMVVDDDADVRYSFKRLFERADYAIIEASSGEDAVRLAQSEKPDVILMDIRMPGADGIATLREIRRFDPRTPVILMTAYASTQSTIEAMKAGAFDHVMKPFDIEKIRSIVSQAVKASQDMRRVVSFRPKRSGEGPHEEIIGQSESMQEVYKLIGRVAAGDQPVLLTGERGTGKQLVARAIYHHSARNTKPFLAINCAIIPPHLLEGELFGWTRTAALRGGELKTSKLEICDGGTLLLHEIGAMTIPLQTRLLRVMETGQLEKFGGMQTVPANIRIIASSSADLHALTESGDFRSDLYFALRASEINLPPLSQRKGDIPLLVAHYVEREAPRLGLGRVIVDPAAMALLEQGAYESNVRELENIVRNTLVGLKGNVISAGDLEMKRAEATESAVGILTDDSLFDALFQEIARRQPLPPGFDSFDIIERKLVIRALEQCEGNQSRVAKFLGITRNTLRKRIAKYGLKIGGKRVHDEGEP